MLKSVPIFPEVRDLQFNDQTILYQAFQTDRPQISEYTFTNLYVWLTTHPVQISQLDTSLLILRFNTALNHMMFLPPIGTTPLQTLIPTLRKFRKNSSPITLYGLSFNQAHALEHIGIEIAELRDNWDYLYKVSDLINLPGEKYYSKRKNINKCLENYTLQYSPITDEVISQCLQMQTSWCNLRQCDLIPGLAAENYAVKETFLHYNELNVMGGAIFIEDRVEAFTIAEQLNEDTAVIHFEKANPKITGLYQVINQWFSEKALSKYTYINREQDLGIPGLRRAKMSYHPVDFIKKYQATV
jgi:hypothetical protein